MCKEEVSSGCHQNKVKELLWIFKLTLKEECADLWHIELKVISKLRVEIWVDSAEIFQIFDCVTLMSVHTHQCLDNTHLIVIFSS